jgi:predicted DNA-binding antitoxin AbrB/MazE fold protein
MVMAVTIEAVFENGVFRPLIPVVLDDGTPAAVTVHTVPVGSRFADRVLLPEFAQLRHMGGDSSCQISLDRDRP